MRLANELAAAAMEHVRAQIRPGMRSSEVGAIYEGHVHANGVGYEGKVELARALTLVWSGPGHPHLHRHQRRRGRRARADAARDLGLRRRLLVRSDQERRPGRADGALRRADRRAARRSIGTRSITYVRGASLPELDRLVRAGIAELGYPGQPSHPIAHGVGARAHEPPYAHQAGEGELRERMVLAVEPGLYWPGGGGLRVEDNFLITADGCERLGSDPDDFRGV